MKERLLAWIVAGALALPALAAAQTADTPWSPPRITAGWVFTPTFVFGTEFDDNVTVRGENSPVRPSDTALLVHPRGELDFNGRRTHFSAGYQGTWSQYQTLSGLDRYAQTGRGDLRRTLSEHVEIAVRGDASRAPSTEMLQVDGVPFTRIGTRVLNAGGGITVHPTARSEFGAGYSYQNVQFDRTLVEGTALLSGSANGGSAYYMLHVAPRVGIGAAYDLRDAVVAGGSDRFLIQDALGTVELRTGATTTITGGAGVSYLHVRSTGEVLIGPAIRAAFTKRIQRAILNASFDRSFIPSYGFGGTSRNESAGVHANVPLLHGRLTWSGGASVRRSQPLFSTVASDQHFRSYWLTTSVGYGVVRWLHVEGFYAAAYQDKVLEGGRVVRHRFGVQLVTTKPMRIQ